MHFFSINQKIWHFFVKISQYFKDRICGGAAGFSRCVVFSQTELRALNQRRVSISIYKPMAVVYLLLEYPNNIRDNRQRKNTLLGKYTDDGTMRAYPLYILCLSLMHPSVRFRSGSDEVPMKSL